MADGSEYPEESRRGLQIAGRVSRGVARRARKALGLAAQAAARRLVDPEPAIPDPWAVLGAFAELGARLLADPKPLAESQARLLRDHLRLASSAVKRIAGDATVAPVIEPERGDRRFLAPDWNERVLFDLLKQSYLLSARAAKEVLDSAKGLDAETERKIAFFTRLVIDALAPTNFLVSNPQALKLAKETRGRSLIQGVDNLLDDLAKGKGRLRISTTDESAFRLGENVATTPGKVVFQNDLMQLIQYLPTTPKVFRRPLLIVPPWINKYYILDLQPENSFVRWAVGEGHTVFIVSWVNPDARHRDKGFADYMLEGPLAALAAIEKATGQHEVNIVGYCIGGTLLASTLAWMAAKGDKRAHSATFLTTLVDFAEAGDLKVFIDERQLSALDAHMKRKGFLEGRQMGQVFSLLRDNDMVWSYVVSNYLMGREPPAFDLLYWNADATRMPAMMHATYLRKMYLENKLAEPGGITLAGVPIDLRKVVTPAYIIATQEDHIAPWRATYAATGLYRGPKRFVLAASGHIAGVVNPPAKKKYWHWVNEDLPEAPDDWLRDAKRVEGSWWPDWSRWLASHGGSKINARFPKKAIEDAPGSYVRVRSER
jgi:polyhydroxyalkanoate synthase